MAPGNPSVEIFIRRIDPSDTDSAVELVLQLGYNRSAAAVRQWIEELKNSNDQAAFVACFEDQIAGWIELSVQKRLQSKPYALIGRLVVREGLRGRGIGRLLCLQAERWAWNLGVATVRVTSRSTRVDAHRFYLDAGYRETKTSLVFEKTCAIE